jgi:FtsP/CotA-like multicopper oxidase with cupredoxin domain
MGLYGPFIVKSPEDEQYSGDHILMLDDWYLDATGQRLEGSAQGDMERYGNIETVNGKTGSAIQPLVFRNGELHKLRFINASTAAFHKVSINRHSFRVTHTDGHPLVEPYQTAAITLAPGERIDAEVAAVGKAGEIYAIESERSGLGIKIPLVYEAGGVTPAPSPFVPPQSRSIPGIYDKTPDFILELNSTMDMPTEAHSGMGMQHSGMHHNMSKMKAMPHRMRWTINGKSYPDAAPLQVSVGEVVKVRFLNQDTGMMHPMEHPMHIHGTSFLIVSLNGQRPDRELWKDTVNVSAGEYVDVAFSIPNPGEWMVHCHILDHEDGGLMTTIIAI